MGKEQVNTNDAKSNKHESAGTCLPLFEKSGNSMLNLHSKDKMMTKPVLILIGGAPGVGKSTLASGLNQALAGSIWLDGDDLWRMDPFIVNDYTKQMVQKNIGFSLSLFLEGQFKHVIFSWVMHKKSIVEQILASLNTDNYRLIHLTLATSAEELRKRIAASDAKRDPELALARQATLLAEYPDPLDTTLMSPKQVTEHVLRQIKAGN